jgi:hypothetical protein
MKTIKCLLTIGALAGLTACGKQMPIPEGLQTESETLPVEGKGAMAKSFTIGAFQVKDIKRKGKGTMSASAGGVAGGSASKQKFSFAVTAEGNEWTVECEIRDSESKVGGFQTSGESKLDCTFDAWTLALVNTEGTLSGGGSSLSLATWSANSMMPRPSGFYVKSDAQDVAAVTKEQMVLLKGIETDTRAAVAAAAAALLIYADIPA